MWEVLVSLLSPFNLDLSGAVSAGWVGDFNNVHTCLLEWAQVNNLIWRGRQEIHVKGFKISDFFKTIKDKDLILKIYFFFFANHSTCVITDIQLFFQGKLKRELLNCPTHNEVVFGSHCQPTPPAGSPMDLAGSRRPGLLFTCSVALTFILTFQTNFKLLVHPW